MSEINVQLGQGPATQMPAPVTVGEALKKLDREAAKQALAARVNGREVDLAFTLDAQQNGEALAIEPVLPQTLAGLDVLRHSTAHLLAAAVLDLFPGTKLGIGPLFAKRQSSNATQKPPSANRNSKIQNRKSKEGAK